MKKLGKICNRCRKPKHPDCQICKRKAFEGISKENYSFYNSSAWRKLSKHFRKNNPLCVHCLEKGVTTPCDVTDHIVSIDKGGAKWDINNFQALCHKCHNTKTARSK